MDEGGDHDGGDDHGDDRDLSGRIDVVRRVVPDVPIQVQTAAEPEGIPADPASEIRVVMFVRNRASPHLANLLQQRARAMRFSPTRSEEWLWRRLAGSKTGLAFRRQLVIGPFIVDFACTKVRLVVEVDGGYHEDRQLPDAQRDRDLENLGWRVLRIAEHDIFANLDAAVARILHAAA